MTNQDKLKKIDKDKPRLIKINQDKSKIINKENKEILIMLMIMMNMMIMIMTITTTTAKTTTTQATLKQRKLQQKQPQQRQLQQRQHFYWCGILRFCFLNLPNFSLIISNRLQNLPGSPSVTCRYLSCSALGLSAIISLASLKALEAFCSPSAAITCK